jgi:ribosomal protein L37E
MSSALIYITDLLGHGIRLYLDPAGNVTLEDRQRILAPGDLRMLRNLKSLLRDLLRTELPDGNEAAEEACEGFTSAVGVALCRRCGHGLAAHYWRHEQCIFHVGSDPNTCRRCGDAAIDHLPARHRQT